MQNYILLLIILLLGCSEKRSVQIIDIPLETINFSSLKKENSPFPDSLIMHKQYINISTTNKELLFSSINQIEINDNYIYILDSYIRILAVFDLDGNAIGRVGNIGRAPGEYLNADSFSIDSLGRIYIIDGQQDKINVYDNSFNSIYSKKLPLEIDILHCLPGGKFLTGLCSWNKMKNTKDKIILIDSNLITQKVFCQYDKYVDNNTWFSDYYFIKTANCIFYNRPLDNMVYQFSTSGIPMKGFYFDFGKKEIPQQAKMNYEKYKELYKHTQALIYFTIINNQYILGQIREDNQNKTFLIDRSKDIVYINEHPLSNNVGKLIGCNGDQIISYISPGEYLKANERNEKMDLPQEVINHLKNEGFTLCIFELPN